MPHRKSVRGCIVDGNMSVIAMVIVKKGEGEIPGLTDNTIPRRLGPKRASKIPKPLKEGKTQKYKAPKIQRLITPAILQRRRHLVAIKRSPALLLLSTARSWHRDKRSRKSRRS